VRKQFLTALIELARKDPRIAFLTADLGYTVVETFRDAFPGRFFNVGVAEQNMLGIATGLAEAGLVPFVYSIGTFATARAYEFIRNGPLLHQLPVRIVGVGSGFEYGTAGFTHHVLEDVGLMSLHAGMTVITPADAKQSVAALNATANNKQPIYFRLGKDETYEVPGLNALFTEGRAQLLRDGKEILFIALGTMAREVAAAAEILSRQGVDVGILLISCVQPLPARDLQAILPKYRHAITVEAHTLTAGIGAMVGSFIAENAIPCRLTRCAVRKIPDGVSGSERFMLQRHGLDAESLARLAGSLHAEMPRT